MVDASQRQPLRREVRRTDGRRLTGSGNTDKDQVLSRGSAFTRAYFTFSVPSQRLSESDTMGMHSFLKTK